MMVGFISRRGQVHSYRTRPTGRFIFDGSGKLRLEPQEQRIINAGMNCAIYIEWKLKLMTPAFANGFGEVTITSNRIIFTREIDLKAMVRHGAPQMMLAYYDEIKRQGGREFFEIRWEEIKGFYTNNKSATFYILSEDEKYMLYFFQSKYIGKMIGKVTEKIPSLHRFDSKREVRELDKYIESKKIYRFLTPLSDQPKKASYELLFWLSTMFTVASFTALAAWKLTYFIPFFMLGIIGYVFTYILKLRYKRILQRDRPEEG